MEASTTTIFLRQKTRTNTCDPKVTPKMVMPALGRRGVANFQIKSIDEKCEIDGVVKGY